MNKQESIKNLPNEFTRETAMTYIENLALPLKPVLTPKEAEWVEELKKEGNKPPSWNKFDLLYFITREGFGFHGFTFCEYNSGKEINLESNPRDYEIKTRLGYALLFGYTIRKEKFYTAKLKSTGEYLHYDKDYKETRHERVPDDVAHKCEGYHFTEDDLIKYYA